MLVILFWWNAAAAGSVIIRTAHNACSVTETPESTCGDSIDNDCDGLIDCLDDDCDAVGTCEYGTELTCDDSVDNDGDGDIDGADSDCSSGYFAPVNGVLTYLNSTGVAVSNSGVLDKM